MEKICLFCKYFRFLPATPGYSDVTPGNDAWIGCGLNYWQLDHWEDNEESYRAKQLTAQTCKEFEQVDLVALGVKVS
jgi:hypothetical protein